MLRYPESAVATIAAEALVDGSSEILSAANRSTSEARTITNSLSKKACDEAKNIVSKIPENDFQNLKFKEIPRCCFEPKKIPLSRKETAKVWKTLAKRAQAKNPSRNNIPMEELAKDFESVANEVRAAKAEIKNNPTARSNRSRKRGARQQHEPSIDKEKIIQANRVDSKKMKDLVNSLYEYGQEEKCRFEKLGLEAPSKDCIDHITSKHFKGGAKYKYNKQINGKIESAFNNNENIVELALEAWENGTTISPKEKFYKFNRMIGHNSLGEPTNKVKIIINRKKKGFASFYPQYK